MKRFRVFSFILLSLFTGSASAQDIQIADERLHILPYAHLKNLQSGHTLVGDADGFLHLSPRFCHDGDTLELSYLSFQTMRFSCAAFDSMPNVIVLKEDTQFLPEAQVLDYENSKTFKIRTHASFGRRLNPDGGEVGIPVQAKSLLVQELILADTQIQIHEIRFDCGHRGDSILLRFSVQDTFNTYLHEVFAKELWVKGGKIKLDELKLHCHNPSGHYFLFLEFLEIRGQEEPLLRGRHNLTMEETPCLRKPIPEYGNQWFRLTYALVLKVRYGVE